MWGSGEEYLWNVPDISLRVIMPTTLPCLFTAVTKEKKRNKQTGHHSANQLGCRSIWEERTDNAMSKAHRAEDTEHSSHGACIYNSHWIGVHIWSVKQISGSPAQYARGSSTGSKGKILLLVFGSEVDCVDVRIPRIIIQKDVNLQQMPWVYALAFHLHLLRKRNSDLASRVWLK